MDVEPPIVVDDLPADLGKCASKGKGRDSVRESLGLGKSSNGAHLAPVRAEDGAASELIADRDVSSVDASPQRGRSPGGVLGNREGPGVFAAPDVV